MSRRIIILDWQEKLYYHRKKCTEKKTFEQKQNSKKVYQMKLTIKQILKIGSSFLRKKKLVEEVKDQMWVNKWVLELQN